MKTPFFYRRPLLNPVPFDREFNSVSNTTTFRVNTSHEANPDEKNSNMVPTSLNYKKTEYLSKNSLFLPMIPIKSGTIR